MTIGKCSKPIFLILPLVFLLFLSLGRPLFGQQAPGKTLDMLRWRANQRLTASPFSPPKTLAGNLLWSCLAQDNAECVRSIPDVNGNGTDDAVAGFGWDQDNENLYCMDGASTNLASFVWKIETAGGVSGGYFYGDQCLSTCRDLNGDGMFEVLAGLAGGGRTANAYEGDAGSLLWQLDTYNEPNSGWVYSIRELGDINFDALPEVIFGCGSDNDSVYCIDGASVGTSPTVLWSYPCPDAVFSVAPIMDLDGDGLPEVLAATGDNDGVVYCIKSAGAAAGTLHWSKDPGGTIWCVESISDVNGSGYDDVVCAVWNFRTTVLSTCDT